MTTDQLIAQVIAAARRYKGVTENPRGSNRQQFGVWYGMNAQPWCAMFLSFVVRLLGVVLDGATTAKGFAYCPAIAAYFKSRGLLSSTPKVGSWALFHNGSRFYHVELVTAVGKTTFTSIGGNTGPSNLSNGGMVLEHSHARGGRTMFCDLTPFYAAAARKAKAPAKVSSKKPATASEWDRNLAVTSPYTRGDDVLALQRELIKRKFLAAKNRRGRSNADGVYGEDTEAAVIKAQKSFGITADGVAGPVTANRLGLA